MGSTSRCVLLAAVVIASSSAGAQNPATSSTGIRVAKERYEPPPPPPPPPAAPAPAPKEVAPTPPPAPKPWEFPFFAFDAGAYQNMTEKNIAAHMASVDTLRLQLDAIGMKKLSSDRAREFLDAGAREDIPHLTKLYEIITDEKVGSIPLDPDPEVARLRQAVRKFSLMPAGPEFEGAYFRFQVEHYANELGILIASRGNAHDDDFESFIDDTRPRLQQRREAALAILSTMPQR